MPLEKYEREASMNNVQGKEKLTMTFKIVFGSCINVKSVGMMVGYSSRLLPLLLDPHLVKELAAMISSYHRL